MNTQLKGLFNWQGLINRNADKEVIVIADRLKNKQKTSTFLVVIVTARLCLPEWPAILDSVFVQSRNQSGLMRRRGVYVMLTLCGVLTAALIAFLVILLTGGQGADASDAPTVTLELSNGQGEVLGNYGSTAWTDQTFMQFRGIPFAEPPTEELRFRVSQLIWCHKNCHKFK